MVSKEHVKTYYCITNAAGTYTLKLAVIGKSKNPHVFNNIDLPYTLTYG